MPHDLLRYVVEKGSITVDGVSLTVAAVLDDGFAVAVIPHTLAVTTLGTKRDRDPVNLEVDVVAKYVERMLHPQLHPDVTEPIEQQKAEAHAAQQDRGRDRGDCTGRDGDRGRQRRP